MVFLSKVSFMQAFFRFSQSDDICQLKNPHARSFTHVELRDAMMETIHCINKLCKEAGCVSLLTFLFIFFPSPTALLTCFVDRPVIDELCRH